MTGGEVGERERELESDRLVINDFYNENVNVNFIFNKFLHSLIIIDNIFFQL